MQNLSLHMSQAATQNKVDGAAGKVNSGLDKASSGDQNSSFKMVLSKQVQSQQTTAKQAPMPTDKSQKTSAKVTAENATLQPKSKVKTIHSQHHPAIDIKGVDGEKKTNTISKDVGLISNPNVPPIEKVNFDSNTSLTIKNEIDTKAENINITAQDSSAIVLSNAGLVPLMNSIPLMNTQNTTSEPQLTSRITTTPENAPNNQYDLDAMLNSAMSQSKNVDISENSMVEPKVAQGDLTNAGKNHQLDTALPSMVKPAIADGSDNAKLMLSVMRDGMAKDAAMKDVAIPAGLQSVAQVNATLPTQQVASANVINAYPGKAGWDQAISQKVVWMVGAGQQSATLTLNPPDLGPLQVVIHIHNDQADTTFISNNAEVRQALQDGMSNLRDKMSESGLQLGQANVSSGQQSQQQFQQASQQNSLDSKSNNHGTSPSEVNASSQHVVRVANGLVDTFA